VIVADPPPPGMNNGSRGSHPKPGPHASNLRNASFREQTGNFVLDLELTCYDPVPVIRRIKTSHYSAGSEPIPRQSVMLMLIVSEQSSPAIIPIERGSNVVDTFLHVVQKERCDLRRR
jgi:hypothetical protein